jgi:hypothetical protein
MAGQLKGVSITGRYMWRGSFHRAYFCHFSRDKILYWKKVTVNFDRDY